MMYMLVRTTTVVVSSYMYICSYCMMISNINNYETMLSKIFNVKLFTKRMQLFLGENRKVIFA